MLYVRQFKQFKHDLEAGNNSRFRLYREISKCLAQEKALENACDCIPKTTK